MSGSSCRSAATASLLLLLLLALLFIHALFLILAIKYLFPALPAADARTRHEL
jgi:hypothetical protein